MTAQAGLKPKVKVPRSTLGRQSGAEKRAGRLFQALLMACLAFGVGILAVLLYTVIRDGGSRFDLNLFRNMPSTRDLDTAGMQSAIVGTIYVIAIVAVVTVPLGIMAAVYLEEYADPTKWFNRAVELNIQNLAAVPSIVYGILGIAFFVNGLSLGKSLISTGLTLSLLVLPVIVISCREAIRAIPTSIREGSLALGATRLQTVRRQILPNAIPGTATGSILALSRAIGEAAPVLLVAGGLTFITFNPESLTDRVTVLPVQIFSYLGRPDADFATLAAAGIIALLLILIVMNAFAVFIRNKFQRDW